MIKHHRVQIKPVAVRARFWVKDNFSAGRAKSDMPAMTSAHFMTGALIDKRKPHVSKLFLTKTRKRVPFSILESIYESSLTRNVLSSAQWGCPTSS